MLDDGSSDDDEIEDSGSDCDRTWLAQPAPRRGIRGGDGKGTQQHAEPDQVHRDKAKASGKGAGQITTYFAKLPLGEAATFSMPRFPLLFSTMHVSLPKACMQYGDAEACAHAFMRAAAPTEADYAAQRRPSIPAAVSAVDAPLAPNEAAMDLLDFVNLKVFGNTAFRRQQREIIEAVLKVQAAPVAFFCPACMHAYVLTFIANRMMLRLLNWGPLPCFAGVRRTRTCLCSCRQGEVRSY
jgi:hypothetical protein